MKNIQKFLLTVSFLPLLACTEPGRTTGIGAATGGVIGAGLGAIVGNQVGSTGAGLVLGGAAGAAAGAAVGNALEDQEKKIAAQDESIRQKEETLRAQQNQINEIRRLSDQPSGRTSLSYNRSDSYSHSSFSSGGSLKDAPDVRRATPSEISQARASVRNLGAPSRSYAVNSTTENNTYPRAQMNVNNFAPQPLAPSRSLDAPKPIFPSRSSNGINERDLVAPPTDQIGSEDGGSNVADPANEEAKPIALNNTAPSTSNSGECDAAKIEVTKASVVTESADKLFHLRRALRMCPNKAECHNQLGELYRAIGRTDDAKFEFQEALRINPSLEAAIQNMSQPEKSVSAGHQEPVKHERY